MPNVGCRSSTYYRLRRREWFPLFAPLKTGDGSLARAQQNGLNICAELDTRHFQYTDPATQQVQSLEIDMFNHVADYLGISQVNHVDIPWASGIPAVQAGQCGMFAEALAIRSDRAKTQGVTYTTPYMLIDDVITVRSDSGINTIDDLRGKTIPLDAGTTDELTARSQAPLRSAPIPCTCLVVSNSAWGIARALAMDPDIILFEEPTAR